MKKSIVTSLGLFSLFFTMASIHPADSRSPQRSFQGGSSSRLYVEPPRSTYNGKCPRLRYMLKNGQVKLRNRGRIAKFTCDPSYTLHGKAFATCLRTQWNVPLPICLKSGCPTLDVPINGGYNMLYNGALLHYWCHPGYSMSGSHSVYCDGDTWNDTVTPACQVSIQNPPTMCDFEGTDLCGWVEDNSDDFDWKRHQFATPSGHVGTGPSFDHTSSTGLDGYYMYIEASAPRKEDDKARLYSPVYSADLSSGCFVMWYHMYGVNTGILRVYIRGDEQVLDELSPVWEKKGEQGNQWLRATVDIAAQTTDFQIVIEGIVGNGYVGDIAIDDVSLRTITCDDIRANEDSGEMNGTCANRCFEDQVQGGNETCECNAQCDASLTCCPDYLKICVRGKGGPSSNTSEPPPDEITTTSIAPSEKTIISNITSSNANTTKPTTIITNKIESDTTGMPTTQEPKTTTTIPTTPKPTTTTIPTTPKLTTTTPRPTTTTTPIPTTTTTPIPTTTTTPRPTTTSTPRPTTTSTPRPTTTSTPRPTTTTTPRPTTTTTPRPTTTTTPRPTTTTTPRPTTTTTPRSTTTTTPRPTTTTTPRSTTTTTPTPTTTPKPTTTTTKPTTTTLKPTMTTPKPTTTPKSTTTTAKPTTTTPEPTTTTPEPTTTTPEPTTTTPEPTTTTLKPTATTPKPTTMTAKPATTLNPTTLVAITQSPTITTSTQSTTSTTRESAKTMDHDYHYPNYYDPDQYSYEGHDDRSKEIISNGDFITPLVVSSNSKDNSKTESSVWGVVIGVLALTGASTIVTILLVRKWRRNRKRANDELHTRFLSDKEEVYFS